MVLPEVGLRPAARGSAVSLGDPMFDGLVQVRLSFDGRRQAGRTGQLIRDWFDLAWRELGGAMRDRVAAAPAAAGPVPHGIHLLATTLVPADEEVFFAYDMASWDRFLDWIAAAPTEGAAFHAVRSDAAGAMLPSYRTDEYWRVFVNREPWDGRDLVQLTIESKQPYLYADPAREAAVVAFLDRMARRADADYAEAGFGYGGLGTVVDCTTYTYWWDSAGQARERLRGYSWLTMVPAPLVSRLGGAARLRATGAFAAVAELPGGAVLLRATEHFRDYRDAEAQRVFAVLRPVLRPEVRASAFRRRAEARGL
jgi:hypothetical protein